MIVWNDVLMRSSIREVPFGTDFYKTMNNMTKGSERHTRYTAYFRNPLARVVKRCGYDSCWLDFQNSGRMIYGCFESTCVKIELE